MKHIVLTTWGSLGDLHPMLALALELQRRGHRATVATSAIYRAKIENCGVGFHAVRPNLPRLEEIFELMQRVMHTRRGTEFLFRDLLMPALRDSYRDLSEIAPDCDLIVTHPAQLAGPIIAQKFALRWASVVLAPISLYSVFDPPVLPHPLFAPLYRTRTTTHLAFLLMRLATRSWVEEVRVLRREIGLARGAHPMAGGQYSPQLNIAMFSRELGAPQSDWPRNTVQSGFAFYDARGALESQRGAAVVDLALRGDHDDALSPALRKFLDAGEAPIVFTLGSAAVHKPGDFYRQSAQAARLLGRRAILLGDISGQNADASNANSPNADVSIANSPNADTSNANASNADADAQIVAFDYAPYSQLFSRSCAVVHQGGVGTTAQAMRSGRPQLVVPHSHDQPDNAARIARRKIGRALPLCQYQAQRVADELRLLLGDIEYSNRARKTGAQVQDENGAATAADALEKQLR